MREPDLMRAERAAELAAELWGDRDVHRIDLSAAVTKYIGETEKNLELAFAAAREADAVLLFDEADALFGKRPDVKDSHDRYTDTEVGALLRRIEDAEVPVILRFPCPRESGSSGPSKRRES